MVTFATVGYGDFSAATRGEMVLCVIFMLCSFALSAYILANVTELVTQADEHTRLFQHTFGNLKKARAAVDAVTAQQQRPCVCDILQTDRPTSRVVCFLAVHDGELPPSGDPKGPADLHAAQIQRTR